VRCAAIAPVLFPLPLRTFSRRLPLDVHPFHHKNLFFNILTDYDLSFQEIRGILDRLSEIDAFKEEREADGGVFYDIQLGQVLYEVDVNGYEVVIYRRTELAGP
jgi:hypothetical protein